MIFLDQPPKLWVPEKPAIIRAALPLSPQERRMRAMFQPGFIGRVSIITGAYLGVLSAGTTGDPATLGSFSFGAAATGRKLVACVGFVQSGAANPSAVTIGGVSASMVVAANAGGSAGVRSSIWVANVPTGTSGNVVVSTTVNGWAVVVHLYSLLGASSATPSSSSDQATSGRSSFSAAVTAARNGYTIAVMTHGRGTAGSDTGSFGSVTQQDEVSPLPNFSLNHSMSGSVANASAGSLTVTASNSANGGGGLSVAAWAPA